MRVGSLTECTIAVIGLGLMGASLGSALCGKCRRVVGVDQSGYAVETAMKRGFVDVATTCLEAGIQDADVLILATPVRKILGLIDTISLIAPEGSMVMDLGSTKTQITAKMENLPRGVQAVGGHPMCGREKSGVDAADAGLYHKSLFFLTPLKRTSEEALSMACALVQSVEARPYIIEAERHDRLVAAVSHLPYLLACGLVRIANEVAYDDTFIWQAASSGFRDTSRLAACDVSMMMDILMTNREAILWMLEAYSQNLNDFARSLERRDEGSLRQLLIAVHERRRNMF